MYQLFWAFHMYTLFNIRPMKQTQYSHITNLEMIKNCNNNFNNYHVDAVQLRIQD